LEEVPGHELYEAHAVRQRFESNGGSSFSLHDDWLQGDESFLVKITEDVAGVPHPTPPGSPHLLLTPSLSLHMSRPNSSNPSHTRLPSHADSPASVMRVVGAPDFEYGKEAGSAAHFISALQHESEPAKTSVITIKFALFFRRVQARPRRVTRKPRRVVR